MSLRAGLSISVLCVALAACGEETPLRAIYEIAHDLEHEDADAVCARLFPAGLLPARIATALGVPPGEGEPRRWETEQARCARDLRHRARYADFSFEAPIVRGVEAVPVTREQGITAAARARVELKGQPERILPLVEFQGKWRVVTTRWATR